MGLDILAISKIKLAGKEAFDEYGDLLVDKYVKLYVHPDFPNQADDIEDRRAYSYDEDNIFSFRAGSYSGYNRWRDMLANMAGYGDARTLWKNPRPGPFSELVNFSDCEGVIGPKTSAKLAKDFAEYQHVADNLTDSDYFKTKYAEWRKAFEIASDGGVVIFH